VEGVFFEGWKNSLSAQSTRANEAFIEKHGFVSKVHSKKLPLKPRSGISSGPISGRPSSQSRVERIVAALKMQKVWLISSYNMRRLLFSEKIGAAA